jgi:hypothetical protein
MAVRSFMASELDICGHFAKKKRCKITTFLEAQ